MLAHFPVEVISRWLEVRQERDGALQRRELARLDGLESSVSESRRERVVPESTPHSARLEGADAATQPTLATSSRNLGPGHEQGAGTERGRGAPRETISSSVWDLLCSFVPSSLGESGRRDWGVMPLGDGSPGWLGAFAPAADLGQ